MGHFHGNETCLLSMSAIILIAVDTLSNTAESEKKNKLINDPYRDVTYHCCREYFSLGNAINKPRRWSHAQRLLQKHETVPFTHVNVAALLIGIHNGLSQLYCMKQEGRIQ